MRTARNEERLSLTDSMGLRRFSFVHATFTPLNRGLVRPRTVSGSEKELVKDKRPQLSRLRVQGPRLRRCAWLAWTICFVASPLCLC